MRDRLLIEFDSPDGLLDAARAVREAGLRDVDAFTPFPVEGLPEALGFHERIVPLAGLFGGLAGAVIGYGMQVIANYQYPLDIGGRPLFPPQAFGMVTFELTVLGAVLSIIFAFFLLCRLPRLNHPLFDIERFEHATVDSFFLLMPAPGGGRADIEKLLSGHSPRSIAVVTV